MKLKSLVTVIAMLFAFSFCSASCSNDNERAPRENNENGNNDTISTTKMKITIGTTVFTATLYNNPSAAELKAMLPLTLNMTELNGNEKYYDFPGPFLVNTSVGGDIKAGDLMLYGNNVLVLFYKSFNTSYRYTKLGYIDNPTGLATAMGAGNVVVKFENN
ncbi:cyclophilin-like fold protein [Flavobacterium sp. LAR06]|uniref:cyclophilin-like fold protein n=1 Tax=Flavobacterium sp. LAR06 TaxID=3064897 RepID=UPI0035C0A5CA